MTVSVVHTVLHKLKLEHFCFVFVKIETLCSFQTYIVPQVAHLSGVYRQIWTAEGANQIAPFQCRPVQL